jgi:hypothetical protein
MASLYIHHPLDSDLSVEKTDRTEWMVGIEGNFRLHRAVVEGKWCCNILNSVCKHSYHSLAPWDESHLSGNLRRICLDKYCENHRRVTRSERKAVLPQSKPCFANQISTSTDAAFASCSAQKARELDR